MKLPIDEPTDKTKRMMNKKTIWTLTIRLTAVRLMGAAVSLRASQAGQKTA
jgi:hypothetical protein